MSSPIDSIPESFWSWEYFIQLAQEAKTDGVKLNGDDGEEYSIMNVKPTRIYFRFGDKEEEQGKAGYNFFMDKLRESNGRRAKRAYKGILSRMWFIIALHPRLRYDKDSIVVE